MGRTCTICSHPKRKTIDKEIAKGASNRSIAARYGISTGTVQRHKKHVKKSIKKARDKTDIAIGKSAIEIFDELLKEAEDQYKVATVLTKPAWFKEWRGMVELGFKLGMEAQRQKRKEKDKDATPAVLGLIDEVFK